MNRASCLKVIAENLPLFQKKIGLQSNSGDIFNFITSYGDLFRGGMNNSQALYGILLGYGKVNSLGFEARFSKESSDCLKEIEICEHEDISDGEALLMPSFASFSQKETEVLMGAYHKQKQKIIDAYRGKDFLEKTIMQLTLKMHDH